MTVAEMLDELIRVVSKKEEEKFEGILDTASLKELNKHYDQMSSSVSESKVPDLVEEAVEEKAIEVVKLYPYDIFSFVDGKVLSTITNYGDETVSVQLPKVIREKQQPKPDPSFDSYSVHTGEIKI